MHIITVTRAPDSACFDVLVDSQFVMSSPSKAFVGEAVLDAIAQLDEPAYVAYVDAKRGLRERAEASRLAQEASRDYGVRPPRGHEHQAEEIVRAARSEKEPWRP